MLRTGAPLAKRLGRLALGSFAPALTQVGPRAFSTSTPSLSFAPPRGGTPMPFITETVVSYKPYLYYVGLLCLISLRLEAGILVRHPRYCIWISRS